MTTTTTTFDIAIGPDFKRSYRLWETTAPEDYDGFGTMTVTGTDDMRWVLVAIEHETWQTLRYRSGMFSATPAELDGHEQFITERLYQRLIGQEVR